MELRIAMTIFVFKISLTYLEMKNCYIIVSYVEFSKIRTFWIVLNICQHKN